MGEKTDKKLVNTALIAAVFICLVIGLGIGYAFAPRVVDTAELEQRIDDLEGQINDKDNQLAILQSQLNEKNDLISELQSQLPQKDNQIQELQEQVNDLVTQMAVLNQSYQELQADYEELLSDYKMLNAPVSNFTSVGDLDFTIATHQHIYSYEDSISGNITIYYNNGTAFKGTFSIYIKQLDGAMSSGWTFYVDGYGDFYVNPPAFIHGPGTYQIGLIILYDSEGYIIESSWLVFPSVQVEAK